MFPVPDIHTHDYRRAGSAIINISPDDSIMPGALHSVGIHPWQACEATENTIERLTTLCSHPQVVAIGETGLDAMKGGSINHQLEIFNLHITLSEQHRLPLIIHAVKTFDTVIRLKKRLKPAMPWIIHGFRGKPQLAVQLLNHGFYISLGEKFNPATAAIIPDDRLFTESDESLLPISAIIDRINEYRR